MIRPATRLRIAAIVRDRHLAFTVRVLGPDAVTPQEHARLQREGMLAPPSPKAAAAPHAALLTGEASARDDAAASAVTDEQFWRKLADMPVDLTEHQRHSIEAARTRIGGLIKGIGDRVAADVDQAVDSANATARHSRLMTVRRTVANIGVVERQSHRQVESALRRALGDAQRDWQAVAATELHNVEDEGRVLGIIAKHPPGHDPVVFKRPRPDACAHCKLLYTRDGTVPRLFHLSELIANGTNHKRLARRPQLSGKNRTQWRAVIGATHPWCQCVLQELPEGFTFDKAGQLIYTGRVRKSLDGLGDPGDTACDCGDA